MTDPVADTPAMDEFAQTRGGDDLFDDEIVPVAAESEVPPEVQALEENVASLSLETQTPPPRTETPPRSRGGERRGRGRGKGRGGRQGSQNPASRRGDGGSRAKSADEAAQTEKSSEEPSKDVSAETTEQAKKEDATSDSKPSAEANGQRVPAVRGDRSATGGIKKENAARKAAAHARAEADQASFLEREKVAEEKRRQERQNRRVMDNERERNRQRKLQALGGREWDSQKQEEDYNPRGGRGGFRRGMHGGVSGYVRRDFGDSQPDEETNNHHHNGFRGRGRGGRGGRGRGRGPRPDIPPSEGATNEPSSTEQKPAPAPVIDNEAEFPSLPGGSKKESTVDTDSTAAKLADVLSPIFASGATWAEQVENN
ncbi:unnamed protein product [Aspergillus oryzae]|uniref:Unnamed protein product n=2 Tax=Aspergillus oryzae TaxID=5062 RepID=A0AAN4YER8_ASPOZ|nr:unnamed protein product [Aspergillus oryzae]GMF89280.1 unnamed protein product [Aspergillus oryzae]GMG03052.1 unnamed protein product [Aspergillus oryzae]GMG28316.1 unnamed protein product [Aspergillus oryzae]GMG50885.1 unnamed protein product [Aspergillus oryzae var. brunneus]